MSKLRVNDIFPANGLNIGVGTAGGNFIVGGASTTVVVNGDVNTTGTISASTFVGDGSGITGVTASGSGINIKDSGSVVGVAATIDFSTNLNVSPASAGIVTVTVGDTDFAIVDKIVHTGDTDTAIRFPAADTISAETGGSERLRINSSGNIGIGTDNPSDHNNFSRALDINGPSGAAVYMRTSGSSTNTFIVGNYGSDAYLNNVANGNIKFYTQGDERLRIDSSGRVGINTNTFNDAAEALRVQAPSGQDNTHLTIKAGSTSGYSVLNFGDDDFNEGRIKYDHSSNTMEFFADDTGFMKYIDDSTGGRFSVTSTGTYLTASTVDYYCNFNTSRTYGHFISKNGAGTYGLYCYTLGGSSTQYSIYGQIDTTSTYSSGGGLFYSINSNTYGIVGYWSGGGSGSYYTLYGNGVSLCTGGHTTSDARLKDVQSGIGTGILDKVCSLEAKKYTWKENTQQRRSVGVGTQIGLLAQDVLEHFPEVVMEHENPEITGANPETLNEQIGTTYSIDYGKLTAVLIEAIKDLKEKNNSLAARVAALEAE